MLNSLIQSKTRKAIVSTFFSNPDQEYYIRQLSNMHGISVGALHRELTRFERDNILIARHMGNLKLFSINKANPFYNDLRRLVWKQERVGSK
jgi:RNA-binding protein YlmH